MTTDVTNLRNAFCNNQTDIAPPVPSTHWSCQSRPLALVFVVAMVFLLAVLAVPIVPAFKILTRVFKSYDNLNTSYRRTSPQIPGWSRALCRKLKREVPQTCEVVYQQFVNAESRLINGPAMQYSILSATTWR